MSLITRIFKTGAFVAALTALAVSATGLARAKVEGDTIILGAVVSLTGKYTTAGNHTKRGYDMGVKHINARGGVKVGKKNYKLKVIYYDDESTPARGARLAERLIQQDGVKFMLGPYSSALTEAIAPITEKYKVPMIEGNGASLNLFTKGYKYLFAVLSTSDYYLRETINLAAHHARSKGRKPSTLKIAIAVENDPFSEDIRSGVIEGAKMLGMKIVIDDKLPRAMNDMTETLNKVKKLKPDLLVVSGHSKGAALAVRQVNEQRVAVPMLAITHCESAKIHKIFGKKANGILCAAQWAPSLSYSGSYFGSAGDYSKTFQKEYGYIPPYQAAESSAAVLVWADAFKRAGSFNPKNIRDAIAKTDFMTFYGPVKFDPTGKNVAKSMVLRQIQNGKYIAVAPMKFATGKFQHPRPGF